MISEASFIDLTLRSWKANIDRAGTFFGALSQEELQREVAPGKNRLIYLVGSRTGAGLRRFGLSISPRFLWECLTSRTVSWFPVPATSNPSCRFPAMGLPARFRSRVM
jgi:hypothetical protein